MKFSTLAVSLAGLSFMMTVIWGGPLLRILRHFKIGKLIRVEEPGKHNPQSYHAGRARHSASA